MVVVVTPCVLPGRVGWQAGLGDGVVVCGWLVTRAVVRSSSGVFVR